MPLVAPPPLWLPPKPAIIRSLRDERKATHYAFGGSGASKFPSRNYIGSISATSGPATFTVPAIKANQWVVICANYLGNARTFTINSTSVTALVSGANTAGSLHSETDIFIFKPTVGTTSISVDGSPTGSIAYSCYVVSDLLNNGAASATAATPSPGPSSTLSGMSVPAHALIISCAYLQSQTSQPTGCTWSGGTMSDAITTHTFGVTNVAWDSGSAVNVSAATYTLSFSFTGGSGGGPCGAAIALR